MGFFNFRANRSIGIDLGTANTLVYSKKHKKLENFYKFFVFVLTKEMFLFIMYIKTLKRRVESCLINTETFQLVREMRKKLLNMALESSH